MCVAVYSLRPRTRLGRVNPHAHPGTANDDVLVLIERLGEFRDAKDEFGPVRGLELFLGPQTKLNGADRRGKGNLERVPLGVHFVPRETLDALPHDAVVDFLDDDHRGGILGRRLGAVLDVRVHQHRGVGIATDTEREWRAG